MRFCIFGETSLNTMYLFRPGTTHLKFFLILLFIVPCIGAVAQLNTEQKGLIWEDDRYAKLPLKINYDKLGHDFPPQASLRPYCPRVVNQGGTNTAVSWACVWYARTILDGVNCNRKVEQSNTHEAYNNFFNNRLVQRDCSKPVSMIDILNTLVYDGAKKHNTYKTFCVDSVPPVVLEEAKANRMSGYVRLFNTFDSRAIKESAIKSALSSGNPVVIGMIAPLSFANAGDYWLVEEVPDMSKGGHAVCVVGYDDTKGAIEVVNSWGKTWGREGHTWIRYEELENFVRYGFELFDSQYGPCVVRSSSVSLKFFLTDGTEMKTKSIRPGHYQLEKSWPTKTEFRVQLRTDQKVYVYGIFADPANAIASFFPWPGQLYTNAITSAPSSLELPLGNFPFTLEPPAGTNHLAFVFSSMPMDLEATIKQLTEAPGDFLAKMKQVFKTRSYGQSIQWQQDPRFTVDYDEDMFAVVTVRLDQD